MKIFIHRKNRLLCLFLFAFCSCGKNAAVKPSAPVDTAKTVTPVTPVTVNFPVPNYNPSALDTSTAFQKQPQVSVLARQDLPEISGIAASKLNPGILYIHNDSGNPSQIYLTDAAGNDRGSFSLNVANRDWEDIAVGPGPVAGKSYIYLADIGDNDAKYSSVFVYRLPEPTIGTDNNVVPVDPTSVEKIELKYPDGPRNAETILVDPLTKDIFIASKQSNFSQVYRAAYPQSTTTATTMQPIVRIYINKATGGSVSVDGTEVLIRDNQSIWYWKAQNGQSISDLLKTQPQIAPYANNEPQGEGVGFAIDGSGYFTDTEIKGYAGKQATVSFYGRK